MKQYGWLLLVRLNITLTVSNKLSWPFGVSEYIILNCWHLRFAFAYKYIYFLKPLQRVKVIVGLSVLLVKCTCKLSSLPLSGWLPKLQ